MRILLQSTWDRLFKQPSGLALIINSVSRPSNGESYKAFLPYVLTLDAVKRPLKISCETFFQLE